VVIITKNITSTHLILLSFNCHYTEITSSPAKTWNMSEDRSPSVQIHVT